jgi:hypothetical protein
MRHLNQIEVVNTTLLLLPPLGGDMQQHLSCWNVPH